MIPRPALRPMPAAAAAALLAVAGAGGWATVRVARDPVGPVPSDGFESLRSRAAYTTSTTCAPCHPSHDSSWRKTHHRRMTQAAGPESILGSFDGEPRDVAGQRFQPLRDGDDYFLLMPDMHSGQPTRFKVEMTVGSRRMQQYVTRHGDRHLRLPVAWSVQEKRWFHLAEAFFFPEGSPWHQHTALWDGNCIFCHNVKASPGFTDPDHFDARVAEKGIACEACHGPGDEHAKRMRSPLRRYAMHLLGKEDPTIVNPSRLPPDRAVQVCGHCHGVTIPVEEARIQEIFRRGDPFTAGEDLTKIYQPVTRDTKVGDVPFAQRFWNDGAPRLTAFEWQGLLRSRCHTKGGMRCDSCHSMHGGDPHGQMRPDVPGDAMCLQCHKEYSGDALAKHTRHLPASTGSRCLACHMPTMVYGIMGFHPTHEIVSPDPAHAARNDKPDACTLCHTGRSIEWAAEKAHAWWPNVSKDHARLPERFRVPEMARALFQNEAIYRALAADRLGLAGSPEPETATLAVPLLAEALLDGYPVVRRSARNSLARLTASPDLPYPFDGEEPRLAARARFAGRSAVPPPKGSNWPFLADGRVDVKTLSSWIHARRENPFSFGE